MMEKSSVVLSICIPTFNRKDHLTETLKSIVSQAAFTESDEIEIVISDNCSEDDTRTAAAEFVDAFPEKIRYYRQTPGILPEKNYEVVLGLGRGAFLKLHNDTLLVRDGTLAEMIRIIKATAEEKPVLFFTNGQMSQGQAIEVLNGHNDFVRRVSFYSTWIGGFGMWREEFHALPNFTRHIDLTFVQTDALFRLISMGKRVIVLYQQYFVSMNVANKGGYNIAEVFGKKYLTLLKQYLAVGALDDEVFQAEKRTLLINHIIPYYFDKTNGFLKTGFFPYMQDYLQDAYFYEAIENLITDAPHPVAPAPLPAASAAESAQQIMKARWRALNVHNETILFHTIGPFDFNKVSVGRKTYGRLTVSCFGRDDEILRIGSFVSIADDVTFLLGGNHPYQGFSTFPFLATYFGASMEATTKGPITVGDDVWIGLGATILSGVTIGQGAIVAAGSMVTKNVPPYAIVGGNPAKLIKYRFEKEIVDTLSGLDFSRISDEAIIRNKDILYDPLTVDNVAALVAALYAEVGAEQPAGVQFKEHAKPALPSQLKIAFIGNSLTLHGPNLELNWRHNHGMAASQREFDYAHVLLQRLSIGEDEAYIRNFYPFETDLAVADGHIESLDDVFGKNPPLVIIQLGDNVSDQNQLSNFAHNLQLLVARAVKHAENVFLISTWWQSAPKDDVIRKICAMHNASYVFIGDLFDHGENTDRLKSDFASAQVDRHPKNWGMAQIGDRIFKSIVAKIQ